MKKATKKNKKLLKVVTAVTALGVVAAISFSATFAYLTALSERKTNVFTSEGIDITQTESDWHPEVPHVYLPGDEFDKNPQVTNNANSKANTYVATTVSFFIEISRDEFTSATDKIAGRYRTVSTSEGTKYYKRISANDFTKNYATLEGLDTTHWEQGSNIPGIESSIYYYCGKEGKGQLEELYPNTEKNNEDGYKSQTEELFTSVKFLNESEAMGKVDGVKGQPATIGGNSIPDIKIVVASFAVKAASYADVPAAKTALEDLIKVHINEIKLDGEV